MENEMYDELFEYNNDYEYYSDKYCIHEFEKNESVSNINIYKMFCKLQD